MLLRCGLLLAILSAVQPKDLHRDGFGAVDNDFNRIFSLWPSVHNAATLLRIRRETQSPTNQELTSAVDKQGASEGIGQVKKPEIQPPDGPPQQPLPVSPSPPKDQEKNNSEKDSPPVNDATKNQAKTPPEISNDTPKAPVQEPTVTANATKDNGTSAEKATKEWDLSNPEATKRGLIVFGGFALLAMAYFIFYRTKSKYNEANNSNGPSESNQFRYGVLQSDDRRDNLELSRVPLTMESDEEEDEDLEIFDLGQKKKSLSYVNLQGTDEDIVLSPRQNDAKDQLLLEIDDDNDVLINWSNNKKMTS